MKLPSSLERDIEKIKTEKEKSASEILRDEIGMFLKAIESSETLNKELIIEIVKAISSSRPSMICISNCASEIGKEVLKASSKEEALSFLKRYSEILKKSEEMILQNANFLLSFSSFITASYSSLVMKVMKMLSENKNDVTLFACESKSGDISYGSKYKELSKSLNFFLIPDDGMDEYVKTAEIGIIGADAIIKEGFLINGFPSMRLCSSLSSLKKPIYVITSLNRLTERIPALEEGFDLVPSKIISGFITERGILKFEELPFS